MIEVQCLKCVDQYVMRRYSSIKLESKLENLLSASPQADRAKLASSPQRYGMADRLAPKVIAQSSVLDDSEDIDDEEEEK